MGKGAGFLIGIGYTYWVFYLMMWGFAVVAGGIMLGAIAVVFMLSCWAYAISKASRRNDSKHMRDVVVLPLVAGIVGYLYNLVARNWVQHTVINWWPEQGSWWALVCGLALIGAVALLLFGVILAPYFLTDHNPEPRMLAVVTIHIAVIFAVTVHMLATAPHPTG